MVTGACRGDYFGCMHAGGGGDRHRLTLRACACGGFERHGDACDPAVDMYGKVDALCEPARGVSNRVGWLRCSFALSFPPTPPQKHPSVPCSPFHRWGMSQYDIPWVWQALRGDIASFVTVPDRTHQGVLNHLMVVQLMRGSFYNDPNVFFNGASVVDPTRVNYWGISQGGVLVRGAHDRVSLAATRHRACG